MNNPFLLLMAVHWLIFFFHFEISINNHDSTYMIIQYHLFSVSVEYQNEWAALNYNTFVQEALLRNQFH